MTDAASNPYAEAWPADEYLGVGDHVVKIDEIKTDERSSGGYPQIELTMVNANGSKRDWVVITPQTTGKVGQIIQAIGCRLPDPATEIDGATLELADSYLRECWSGQEVGILIREEPKWDDATKMVAKVKGYVPASKIKDAKTQDFAPPVVAGNPPAPQGMAPTQQPQGQLVGSQPQSAINDDIPF